MFCRPGGEIKDNVKGVEIVTAEALVDVFIQPSEEEGVKGLGKVVTVVRGAIGI